MAITRTGVVISTNPTFGDSDDMDFYINGGQLGINQVPVSGLTPDTVYYAKGYVQQDGTTITDPSYTAFRTQAVGDYFYFKNESNSGNTLTLYKQGTPNSTDLEYTTDGINWTRFDLTQQYNYVNISVGGIIYLRSSTGFSKDYQNYFTILGSARFSVGGNIESLIDYTNNGHINSITGSTFYQMLRGAVNLISAANLDWGGITEATDNGIRNMFDSDTNLVYPPDMSNFEVLSAGGMFYGCTSLSYIPVLTNVESLVNTCIANMFQGCTSITEIPRGFLPNLVSVGSNTWMGGTFMNCTSLQTIPTDLFSSGIDNGWFLETFRNTGITSIPAGLFRGFDTDNYKTTFTSTFFNCQSLTTIPADLFPTTSSTAPYCQQMFAWCSSLRAIPRGLLPATTLFPRCYYGMFQNCTSLTDVPSDLLPATSTKEYCYCEMFMNCSSLATAPDINILDLGYPTGTNDNPLSSMFKNCTSLNKVTTYATRWLSYGSHTVSWLDNVAATGDFYNLGGATIPSGANGIPTGWTEHTSI